jgi:hypothetical protein
MRDARVVDEDVECAEFTAEGMEKIVYRARIANIAGMSKETNFLLRKPGAGFVKGFLIARSQDEVATFGG